MGKKKDDLFSWDEAMARNSVQIVDISAMSTHEILVVTVSLAHSKIFKDIHKR